MQSCPVWQYQNPPSKDVSFLDAQPVFCSNVTGNFSVQSPITAPSNDIEFADSDFAIPNVGASAGVLTAHIFPVFMLRKPLYQLMMTRQPLLHLLVLHVPLQLRLLLVLRLFWLMLVRFQILVQAP
ncbi:unnamed protein product [Cuscuta europaea]|uniref:Uncharacterized protein n=1 Tax=Cuscuta europaea TaxID=41803 RepID=A0A9P0Z8A8_CUSEU|nr:unnamed protein product [Cuscuta europaea]